MGPTQHVPTILQAGGGEILGALFITWLILLSVVAFVFWFFGLMALRPDSLHAAIRSNSKAISELADAFREGSHAMAAEIRRLGDEQPSSSDQASAPLRAEEETTPEPPGFTRIQEPQPAVAKPTETAAPAPRPQTPLAVWWSGLRDVDRAAVIIGGVVIVGVIVATIVLVIGSN